MHSPNSSDGPVQIHRVEIWRSKAFETDQFNVGAISDNLKKKFMVDEVVGG